MGRLDIIDFFGQKYSSLDCGYGGTNIFTRLLTNLWSGCIIK